MKYASNIALVISLLVTAFLVYDKSNRPMKKVGVVQMDKLVYGFTGMKEATERYTAQMKGWQAQTDSLEQRLRTMYDKVRRDSLKGDKVAIARDLELFLQFRNSCLGYQQKTQQLAESEDKEMTLGVVNQVNDYIESYAKQEGFDVILCNNEQQSVGYVAEPLDITAEVLAYANSKYRGVK